MSGKYMTTKRIIIPTITMLLLSSMLFGCSAATKEEAYDMLQETEQIELEIAVPENTTDTDIDTAETEAENIALLPWLQLADLETHPELRTAFEELLGITVNEDGIKSGIVYTDKNGDVNQNNTLFQALGNTNFTTGYIREAEQIEKMEEIANAEYTDIEDNQGVPAVINAYFELLPDQTEGQFEGDATITRAQAMTLIMRATTPVNEAQAPDEDINFTSAVGESQYTNFAAPINQYSYLNTSNGLTESTFNTTMSRGEYIYMITNAIFTNEYSSLLAEAGKEDESLAEDVTLATIQDAGNITFQEAFSNPEKGLPTEMYKTLARAVSLGFVTEGTLNWDEAITKSEAINLFIDAVETFYTNTHIAKDDIQEGGVSVELGEDEYKGDNPYDREITDEELERMMSDEKVQQMINDFLKEHAQEGKIDVDVPGATPHDPSQDGQYIPGEGGEMPDYLKGDFIN